MTKTDNDTTKDSDFLHGLAAIAAFLGIKERQAKHLAATGQIPTFSLGQIRCSTKSGLTKHFAEQMAAASKGVRSNG